MSKIPALSRNDNRFKPKKKPHKNDHLYNTTWWKKTRKKMLDNNPLCAYCGELGEQIDHIVKHSGNEQIFNDENNLQVLCKKCHIAKSSCGL